MFLTVAVTALALASGSDGTFLLLPAKIIRTSYCFGRLSTDASLDDDAVTHVATSVVMMNPSFQVLCTEDAASHTWKIARSRT